MLRDAELESLLHGALFPLHPKVFTQIHAAHRFIGDDIVGTAACEYRTLIDDVCTIADAQRFTDIVIGDQYADAALFQKTYDALNLDDSNRIDAGKGLIKQYEARIGGQRTCNFYAPSFAAGQRHGLIFAQFFDLQVRQ